MSLKRPEILSPAGSMDAFSAALNAGCDAVYLSGEHFGARAFARNFTSEEIIRAISKAHLYGVKVYLTINTLIAESEMPLLFSFLRPLYTEGLDAVIVQDLGAVSMIRNSFPDLAVHASTQMNITSEYGAGLAYSLGLKRVVCARELSLSEIESIKKKVPIELECFVHGALCYCYSGRCLLSSYIGGRSGNRGMCAQPCRLLYTSGSAQSHAVSMKDLCAIELIPELTDAGIDSFKIEGRMKNEYYVAAVTDSYRRMTDDYIKGRFDPDKAAYEKEKLLDIFNRGSFTKGYYFYHNGPEMLDTENPGRLGSIIGTVSGKLGGKISITPLKDINKGDDLLIKASSDIRITSGEDFSKGKQCLLKAPQTKLIRKGDKVYRTRCPKLLDEIKREIIDKDREIDISVTTYARSGERLRVTTSYGSFEAYAEGPVLDEGRDRATEKGEIEGKIRKTGGTGMKVSETLTFTDDKAFVPMKALNEVRREALGLLKEEIVGSFKRKGIQEYPAAYADCPAAEPLYHKYITVKTPSDISGEGKYILDYQYLYELSRDSKGQSILSGEDLKSVYLSLPLISRCDTELGREMLSDLPDIIERFDIEGLLIRNIDSLAAVAEAHRKGRLKSLREVICDSSIYAVNSMAASLVRRLLEGINVLFVPGIEEFPGEIYRENAIAKTKFRNVLMVSANSPGNIEIALKDRNISLISRYNDGLCYNTLSTYETAPDQGVKSKLIDLI